MQKIKLLWLVTVALCVLGALFASVAFALTFELAEWLVKGAAVTSLTSIIVEGEGLLENLLNGAHILCSGKAEGSIGPDGEAEITKIFNLSGVEIKELDEAAATGGLSCSGIGVCANESEVWPVDLPYLGELALDPEDGHFYLLGIAGGVGLAADFLLCLVLGSSIDELCEMVTGVFGELANATSDIESLGSVSPEGECNGNTLDGLIENNSENVALGFTLSLEPLQMSN